MADQESAKRSAPLAGVVVLVEIAAGLAAPPTAVAAVGAQRLALETRVAAVRSGLAALPQTPTMLVAQAANWNNWPKWSKWSNWANQ